MKDEQIKHMVERFLSWKLPENFHPDGGISFEPEFNVEYNAKHGLPPQRREPRGTNLFDYTQAQAMVRYMLDGLPETPSPDVMEVWENATGACIDDFGHLDDKAAAIVIAEAKARWEREAFEKAARVADEYDGSASVEQCDDPSGAIACEIADLIRTLKEPHS